MFRQALVLDPAFSGARINLAELYRASGQNEKSERSYAEAIAISPEQADLRYGHALSLVRIKALPDAIAEFEMAVSLDPDNSRYRTTLAIALDSAGRTADALAIIDKAGRETDANMLGVAIQFGLKLRRFPETLKHAEALARLQPNNPQIADLVRQLRAVVGKN